MQPPAVDPGRAVRARWEQAAPWLLGLGALGAALIILSRQVFSPLDPAGQDDFMQHAAFARSLCQGGSLPPHFFFELVVCGVAAPLGGGHAFEYAAVVIAALAVAAKAVLTYRRIREAGEVATALLAALALLFAMPLFNWWNVSRIYLGQISPNVWHNPTSIAVLPLAMLLFAAASKLTIPDRPRHVAAASTLALLNGVTKPNYLLALIPCWLVQLALRPAPEPAVARSRWRSAAILAAALFAPTAGLLLWQAHRFKTGGGGVALEPLAVWRLYSPNIPASIVLSVAFPLVVLLLCWPIARQQSRLVLAWSVLLVAVLQMALLAESGARWSHGNFFWGAYAANYILFVESAALLASLPRSPRSPRSILAWSILGAHAIAGVVYVGFAGG
jgi:hypothetical protein